MGAGYNMKATGAEADVYIYEDIGEGWFGGVSAKQFAADLRALGAVSVINVHISSYGGEVFDGVAIYRTLVDHPARVVVYVDGVAASSAATVAMAGDEIRITAAGMMMVHNASGGAFGEAAAMRQMADLLDTISSTIADVYAARTGKGHDQITAWMNATTWMTAAEAVERGFADQVVENLKVAASALDLGFSGQVVEQLRTAANGDPKMLYGARDKPKLRPVTALIAHARETLPAMFADPDAEPALSLALTPPRAPTALAARVRLQAARLATTSAR